jgi:sugar phosphate permease
VGGGALWEGFLALGLAGVGVGFGFATMPGLIVRAVPPNETGSALGFYQVVRYVGFAIGSAVSASILAAYTSSGAAFPQREGFTVAMAAGSAMCLVAAVISALVGRARTRPASRPAPTPEPVARVAGDRPAEIAFE